MVTKVTKVSTEEAIREDYKQGLTYRQLAKKYRKSLRDISAILKGEKATAKPREVLSAELPAYLNDEKTKNLLKGLMLTGRITGFDSRIECDIREVTFELVSELTKEGWKINRVDLARFLNGQIEFAVVRWQRAKGK